MISAEQLTTALMAAGIPQGMIRLFDEEFEAVEPSWITGELRQAFERALFSGGITAREGQFDCNKMAKMASMQTDLCWYHTCKSEAVLAIGVLGVSFHMLLVAVHTDGAGLRVACYDPTPQVIPGGAVTNGTTMREMAVTRQEYQECLSCIFL